MLVIDACPFAPTERDTAPALHGSCGTSCPGARHEAQTLQPHSNSRISQGFVDCWPGQQKKPWPTTLNAVVEIQIVTLSDEVQLFSPQSPLNVLRKSCLRTLFSPQSPLNVLRNSLRKIPKWLAYVSESLLGCKTAKTCHISQGSIMGVEHPEQRARRLSSVMITLVVKEICTLKDKDVAAACFHGRFYWHFTDIILVPCNVTMTQVISV